MGGHCPTRGCVAGGAADGYGLLTVRVALITGGGRGLGRGVALALARDGFSLALGFRRDRDAAAATADDCAAAAVSADQRFTLHQGDVASAVDRQRMVAEVADQLGGIDVLINNAGMAPRQRRDLTDASEESFREVLDANLIGPHFLTQLVARSWLEQGAAGSDADANRAVVFITSISAEYASPTRGEYCVSKAGLTMSRQLWAARLANEGVAVFEVRPGIMQTDMTDAVRDRYDPLIAEGLVPQRRWGTAADVGDAVSALLSGKLGFSQGTVLDVDGGFQLRRL